MEFLPTKVGTMFLFPPHRAADVVYDIGGALYGAFLSLLTFSIRFLPEVFKERPVRGVVRAQEVALFGVMRTEGPLRMWFEEVATNINRFLRRWRHSRARWRIVYVRVSKIAFVIIVVVGEEGVRVGFIFEYCVVGVVWFHGWVKATGSGIWHGGSSDVCVMRHRLSFCRIRRWRQERQWWRHILKWRESACELKENNKLIISANLSNVVRLYT